MPPEIFQEEVKEVSPVVEKAAPDAQAEAPVEKEAPAPKEVPSPGESAEEGDDEGEKAAAAPAYKPRDKFKVMVFGSDEQKEHEVPAWLKPLMKDADSEKEVISLLEKAFGLDPVKESRAAVAKERDQVKTEFTKVQGSIQDLRQTYQRGDIDAFLTKLQIPHERMLQWALDKVNYSQLPADQQRALDERTEAQRRAWAAEQQTMTMEQQIQEQSRQAKQLMLESSLSRPDVRTFATSFDTQAGKPGAFFEEVRATGELAWTQSGGKIDLTPDQAVEQVMKKWSRFLPNATPAAGTQPAQGSAAAAPPAQRPATIPNVQGGSKSPLKSGPKSLDDLKKLRDASRAQ